MEIIWLGHACFRLRGREATVLLDPFPGSVGGHTLGRQTADIVCLSNDHPNHSQAGAVEGNVPVLRGPGEYDIKGVLVTGLDTQRRRSGEMPPRNTAFLIEIDEVTICHLGDLAASLSTDQKEQLGSVDVLLIPTGGHCTIDAAAAAETISLIEPKMVVPMHYGSQVDGLGLDGVDRFLKEMGLHEIEPQARLSVTKSTAPETTQVILLEARR